MMLPTIAVEKPWGKDALPAPFCAPEGRRIGEIWFTPPKALPDLLVKYIFTSDKLSVQVHPDDDQAEAAGHGRQGKSECWYVIDAEPGAKLGIGFAEPVDVETMRAAALNGTIEDMLVWRPVRAGDFFSIPARTVHAIGAGVSLIEVQQNSDITYRLYDYGRPRDLHLDAAVAVASGQPFDMRLHRHAPESGNLRLVDGPFFVLDRVDGPIPAKVAGDYPGPLFVVPLSAGVTVGEEPVSIGQCALASSIDAVGVDEGSLCLLARPR